jgi:hypothetical protein
MLIRVMAWLRKHRVAVAIGLATSVVATYLVRGLDWLLPRLLAVLLAAPEWAYVFVVVVLTILFSGFAAATLAVFIHRVSRQLIVWASARLPHYARKRYRDEWLAELEVLRDRPLSEFLFATHVWMGSSRVSRELSR